MNPWGIGEQPKRDPYAQFNAAQERARREYAETPSAFADDPLCTRCQERRREYGYRMCASCRHKMRRGA